MMTMLALLSTLTASGWVVFALCIGTTIWYVSAIFSRKIVQSYDALVVGTLWAWLLWLLTP